MTLNRCMENTVLVLLPEAQDQAVLECAFNQTSLPFEIEPDGGALPARLTAEPYGAVLMAEEALKGMNVPDLAEKLAKQPAWSQLPVIIIKSGGAGRPELLAGYENITLLDRPLRATTLGSTLAVVLRARKQQYSMRALLDERELMKTQMRDAAEAKHQFLAALSHELRTPLSPVLMNVEAMRLNPAVPQGMLQNLEDIQRNVELEARLIDELLDLTQISRGKVALHKEVVDLHRVLDRALERSGCPEKARESQISLRLEAVEHHTFGDPVRLQQIMWHLLANARKFSPAESQIEVVTHNHRAEGISISVIDHGVGIEPELLPGLFDGFQQTSPADMRRSGRLGLSLAICKMLAALHGGNITAYSEGTGLGATFTLELGTVKPAISFDNQNSGRAEKPDEGPKLKILLVEDHEPTRQALCHLLNRSGHQVTEADNVARALEIAAEEPFDLLMSDLGLPDASGLDLMREVHDRYHLPGIALSGYGMEQDIRASREAGFRAHFTKPVDWRRLEETVNAVARLDSGG